jgi:ArsR family transcriptional regulator, arsenate/arsenite/antimonite-responsive transcriptional repressor
MKKTDIDELAWLFKSLGYRKRLEIIDLLLKNKSMNVADMAEALRMPHCTVSQNLAVLARVGLVTSRNKGKFVYYRIKTTAFTPRNMFLLWLIIDSFEKSDSNKALNNVAESLLSGDYKKFLRLFGM